MKKIFKSILFVSILFNFAEAKLFATQKKPIIISDFDKVWINAAGLIPALAHLEPIQSLLKSKPANKNNACENGQQKLHNFPLKLLDYGRCHHKLIPYIPDLIEYFGKSRCINQPIDNLYRHFKNKGHSIVIATNKCRLLYDFAIEALGHEIPNMVDKVFVSEPTNNTMAITALQDFANHPTTPKNYKTMVRNTINTPPTKKILHVPSKKPLQEYFSYVIKHIGGDNDMVFIDDNIKNIDAFNALQANCPYLRCGILYEQKKPDQFIEKLIELGLISVTKDKKLLNSLYNPKCIKKN